jgi:hypothetical protein
MLSYFSNNAHSYGNPRHPHTTNPAVARLFTPSPALARSITLRAFRFYPYCERMFFSNNILFTDTQ